MDNHQAEATLCKMGNSCDSKKVTGTWSPIYDQAFKIELENGMRFLANYKYTIKESISQDPLLEGAQGFSKVKSGDYDKFDSHCDKTMVGFVQSIPKINKDQSYSMKSHKVSCFWGE